MRATVYLDETGTQTGSQRTMIGAVVALDPIELERVVTRRKGEVAADSSLWPDASKRQEFVRDGFHHSVDDDTVRDRFIETMRDLNFRAHVCYSHRKVKGLNDDDLLLAMHYSVIRNLLRRYAGQELELVFETNASLDKHYGRLTMHAISSLSEAGSPRAKAFARIGDKPLGGLSVVDYVLALSEVHLQQQAGGAVPPFRAARFARIASHMAHLIDFDAAAHRRRLARLL